MQTSAYVVKAAGSVVAIFHGTDAVAFWKAVESATKFGIGTAEDLKQARENNTPFSGASVWVGPVDRSELINDCSTKVRRNLTTMEIGTSAIELAWILGKAYGWREFDPEFIKQPHPNNP